MNRCVEFLLAGLLLAAPPAWAEKADRDKPVNVEADSLNVDDARKVAVYQGHVVLSQGTLMMTAERIEIRQDDRGFNTGDATGKPVYFRQKMEGREEFAEGWAEQILYDARADKLKLIGQARLKRGEDDLRGGLIVFDGATENYQAQGSITGTPGRVRAVIRPKTQNSPSSPTTPPAKP